MADSLATPAAARTAVASDLPDHVLMALPKKSSLSRFLRRHRQKATETGDSPLPPIPTDCDFTIPPVFQDFVLFDSGPGEDRILLFGCHQLLDGLAHASFWLADGTFKVVPSLFFQLYTIHFELTPG